MITIVLSRQQTGAAGNAANNVRHNGSIQIRHVHHLKLMRIRDQLHATVVDDHVVVLNVRVVFGNTTRCLQEQTVRQLHDIGLVHGGDTIASRVLGVLEGVPSDALRILPGDDFHGFDDARNRLKKKHTIYIVCTSDKVLFFLVAIFKTNNMIALNMELYFYAFVNVNIDNYENRTNNSLISGIS